MDTYLIRLQFADGKHEVRRLPPGQYRVGRDSAELSFDDTAVSSVHAELTLRRGLAIYRDLGSTNGSSMGGRQLREVTSLPFQELVHLGHCSLSLLAIERDGVTVAPTPTDFQETEPGAPAPMAAKAAPHG